MEAGWRMELRLVAKSEVTRIEGQGLKFGIGGMQRKD